MVEDAAFLSLWWARQLCAQEALEVPPLLVEDQVALGGVGVLLLLGGSELAEHAAGKGQGGQVDAAHNTHASRRRPRP